MPLRRAVTRKQSFNISAYRARATYLLGSCFSARSRHCSCNALASWA